MKVLVKEDYCWGGDFEGEVWESLEFLGYHNYEVSNYGRILSLNHGLMYPKKTKSGYLHIRLSASGKRKEFAIHRLVAMCFVENQNKEMYNVVNHKDENKINNYYKNLEWCNTAYNVTYGTAIERATKTNESAGNFEMLKDINRKRVYCYNKNLDLEYTYNSLTECKEMLGYTNIGNVIKSSIPVYLDKAYVYKRISKDQILDIFKRHKVRYEEEKKNKVVYQYSFKGGLVKLWDDICDIPYKQTPIKECLAGRRKTSSGYIWSECKMREDEVSVLVNKIKGYKKIYSYNIDTYECIRYDNIDCINFNTFSRQSVTSCCNGTNKTHRGYIWSYKELGAEQVIELSKHVKNNGRVILYCYDYCYNKKVYESIKDAVNDGFCKSGIHKVLKGSLLNSNGYIFSYKKLSREDIDVIVGRIGRECKIKPIHQYDQDLNLINIYKSAQDASKNGYVAEYISECCNGKRDIYRGYVWSYTKFKTE